MKENRIAVLGAGTWGMALAAMLAREGKEVAVWSAIAEEISSLKETRRQKNLPDLSLPETIEYTTSMQEACLDACFLLFAVPSAFIRETARAAALYANAAQTAVVVAKGIEGDTLMTMSEVIADEMERAGKTLPVVALSGPTHAEEVAKNLPTAIVAACKDACAAEKVQAFFMNTFLRVYTASDTLGVELCGAVKNIVAIAAGVSAGLGFGDNTAAALMTRGVAELARLGQAMGASPATFYGLAGIGDVIVTATSAHSRNRRAGMLLSKGYTAKEAKEEIGMVVEGFYALPAACALAEKYKVELPIVFAVRDLMAGKTTPREAVLALMTREKKAESL